MSSPSSERRAGLWSLAVACALCVAACGIASVPWTVAPAPDGGTRARLEAHRIVVRIREGGCESDRVIHEEVLTGGSSVDVPAPLGRGEFGLWAAALDEDCALVGLGCFELGEAVPGEPVATLVEDCGAAGERPCECDDCGGFLGLCADAGMDAGVDGGQLPDADPSVDAGRSDVGPICVDPRAEVCNGMDDNCDGLIDNNRDGDGDGSPECLDCRDDRIDIFPGRDELCDGDDTDCDGTIDEGCCEAPMAFDLDYQLCVSPSSMTSTCQSASQMCRAMAPEACPGAPGYDVCGYFLFADRFSDAPVPDCHYVGYEDGEFLGGPTRESSCAGSTRPPLCGRPIACALPFRCVARALLPTRDGCDSPNHCGRHQDCVSGECVTASRPGTPCCVQQDCGGADCVDVAGSNSTYPIERDSVFSFVLPAGRCE